MNTQEWRNFFEHDIHSKKELKHAELHASDFRRCAAGCRLQEIYDKTETQLAKIPYTMIQVVLTRKARHLGHLFYRQFNDDVQGNITITPKAREVFYKIQSLELRDFIHTV